MGILMEDLGALLEEIFVTTVERGFRRLHEEDGVEDHHLGTTEEVVVEDVGEDEIIIYLYVISYQKKTTEFSNQIYLNLEVQECYRDGLWVGLWFIFSYFLSCRNFFFRKVFFTVLIIDMILTYSTYN